MHIILLSDVFGKTPALTKLAHELKTQSIIDPYHGEDMYFNNEAKAYAYFVEHVGLDKYLAIAQKAIQSAPPNSILIGFSVGATVVWRLSEESNKNIIRGIGYYGSQIRHYKNISPLFDIELIFPQKENHYNVISLQNELSTKENVSTTKVEQLHGFMNEISTHYHHEAYLKQRQWLDQFIENT